MTDAPTNPSKATIARRRNAAARRTRILEEGGRRLELLLEGPAAEALDRLMALDGADATKVVSGLLLRSARRRR